jgi:hypothetical protein
VRVSVGTGGTQSDEASDGPTLADDGRFVTFHSLATTLVAGDTNGISDVFLHDLQNGTTERLSLDSGGAEGDNTSQWPVIANADRFVVFESSASNLVGGDTNGFTDIFLRDRGPVAPLAYCTAGTSTNGCVPSISGTGIPSAAAASGFVVDVNGIEGQKQGLIFYGVSGQAATPWGSGGSSFLCIKAPTQRMGAQQSGGTIGMCDGVLTADWLAFIASAPGALGAPFSAGEVVNAQGWYRDPPALKTTNLSNGLEFTLVP